MPVWIGVMWEGNGGRAMPGAMMASMAPASKKVLIVDDDEAICDVLRHTLKRDDLAITTCDTGAKAFSAAAGTGAGAALPGGRAHASHRGDLGQAGVVRALCALHLGGGRPHRALHAASQVRPAAGGPGQRLAGVSRTLAERHRMGRRTGPCAAGASCLP